MTIDSSKAVPIIGIKRLCLNTDGQGITTLVGFHGCPLRCKYCLNPQSIGDMDRVIWMTPEDVIKELKKDYFYFLTTQGGVTFGGGEPFLKADFIKEVLEMGVKQWHVTIETSLNVPRENIMNLFPYIDEYIVDIKDTDKEIYRKYTSKSSERVIENIKWLVSQGKADSIIARIPLIDKFNSPECQERSKALLSSIGLSRFDLFTYITNN